MGNSELKKGSTDLIVLSLLEERPRHGYEIRKLVEKRSHGVVKLNVASLYPLLYRMEARRWIQGRWVEKPGERRRRFYRLTAAGLAALATQRDAWRQFSLAVNRIIEVDHA